MKRRLVVAASAVALLAAAVALPPQLTLASWVDTEYASTGTLTANNVPVPVSITCAIGNNGLGIFQSVTINWKFAAGTSYSSANAVIGTGNSIATVAATTPQPTITGPDGSGVYSATLTSSLLTTLLGSLLGKTFYIGAQTTDHTWTSTWATAKVVVGLAGLGSTCTPTP